jgi:hypothetical protein
MRGTWERAPNQPLASEVYGQAATAIENYARAVSRNENTPVDAGIPDWVNESENNYPAAWEPGHEFGGPIVSPELDWSDYNRRGGGSGGGPMGYIFREGDEPPGFSAQRGWTGGLDENGNLIPPDPRYMSISGGGNPGGGGNGSIGGPIGGPPGGGGGFNWNIHNFIDNGFTMDFDPFRGGEVVANDWPPPAGAQSLADFLRGQESFASHIRRTGWGAIDMSSHPINNYIDELTNSVSGESGAIPDEVNGIGEQRIYDTGITLPGELHAVVRDYATTVLNQTQAAFPDEGLFLQGVSIARGYNPPIPPHVDYAMMDEESLPGSGFYIHAINTLRGRGTTIYPDVSRQLADLPISASAHVPANLSSANRVEHGPGIAVVTTAQQRSLLAQRIMSWTGFDAPPTVHQGPPVGNPDRLTVFVRIGSTRIYEPEWPPPPFFVP